MQCLKDKSYVLTMGEQCHEQNMLEMDFSGNNKTGNTTALTDKTVQKNAMHIYNAIFQLQLDLDLNYNLQKQFFAVRFNHSDFFKGRKSMTVCQKTEKVFH